jgi:signal transduction histidine kinase
MAPVGGEPGTLDHAQQEILRLRAQLGELQARQTALIAEQTRLVGQLQTLERINYRQRAFLHYECSSCLNTIVGFGEVLARGMLGDLNERQHTCLQDLLTSAKWLFARNRGLGELALLEAGANPVVPIVFSLPFTLEQSLAGVRAPADQLGIHLTLTVDPEVKEIKADERKVKRAVTFLLESAVDLTPEEGRIALTARTIQGEIQVAVEHTGEGLSPEEMERIFDDSMPFLPHLRQGRSEVTGCGLLLARRLVEQHGGRLWAEHAERGGNIFRFTLPRLAPIDRT